MLSRATAFKVADLMGPDKSWDTNLLRLNLTPFSAIEAIKTPTSWFSNADTLYWPLNKDGNY